MNSYQPRHSRGKRSRDPLENKMDQLLQTGRQLVDGVVGSRPGHIKNERIRNFPKTNLTNVGRWVEDKLDWLLEEEDDWLESWESNVNAEDRASTSIRKKRPLKAISLRGTKAISPSTEISDVADNENSWPDESSFRVERWERKPEEITDKTSEPVDSRPSPPRRPLPRSNRRRN